MQIKEHREDAAQEYCDGGGLVTNFLLRRQNDDVNQIKLQARIIWLPQNRRRRLFSGTKHFSGVASSPSSSTLAPFQDDDDDVERGTLLSTTKWHNEHRSSRHPRKKYSLTCHYYYDCHHFFPSLLRLLRWSQVLYFQKRASCREKNNMCNNIHSWRQTIISKFSFEWHMPLTH